MTDRFTKGDEICQWLRIRKCRIDSPTGPKHDALVTRVTSSHSDIEKSRQGTLHLKLSSMVSLGQWIRPHQIPGRSERATGRRWHSHCSQIARVNGRDDTASGWSWSRRASPPPPEVNEAFFHSTDFTEPGSLASDRRSSPFRDMSSRRPDWADQSEGTGI